MVYLSALRSLGEILIFNKLDTEGSLYLHPEVCLCVGCM